MKVSAYRKAVWVVPVFLFICTVAEAQPMLRVMSYNIRYDNRNDGSNSWGHRKEKVTRLIRDQRPDVLGIQEALNHQYNYLLENLHDYTGFGVGRDDGKLQGEYAAIFYRKETFQCEDSGYFWLSATPYVPGSIGWDAANIRMVSWCRLKEKSGGKVLYCFNTHFDHQGKIARKESADLLKRMIDSIAGKNPVLLIGDFNASDEGDAYRILTDVRSPLLDAGKVAGNSAGTFAPGFKVRKRRSDRLDYIFCHPAFQVYGYHIIDEHEGRYYPSDHVPILAELIYKGAHE